jgi:predicted DNA-binding transcriptional regulator YafY
LDIKKARERFYYDENPWWGERRDSPFLETIRKSVWQSKKLIISYGKAGEKSTQRRVHPYGMIIKNVEWYLAAYCEQSEEIRTFKCDRIREATLLEETFIIPDGFSLDEYWKRSEKKFKKDRNELEKYKVTIRLHKYDRDLLSKLEVYETDFDNDYIIANINMHKFEFACHEAMDIIGKAEITAPMELRLYVKERIKAIERAYQ